MTINTKVGAFYIDHINDEVRRSTAFLTNVTRLSHPPAFEGRTWEQGYEDSTTVYNSYEHSIYY